MLKYVVVSAVLIAGLAMTPSPAPAAPRSDDCLNCAPPQPYDSDRPRATETGSAAPPAEHAPNADRPADATARDCTDCPPPRRYDSTEVIKTSRDVDQSRVIDTKDVVHVRPKVREHNKLVIRENETRNVGVIRHNHRIIEKETRNVKRAPAYRRAVPAYRVASRVQTVLVPVVVQPVRNCGCPCSCSGSNHARASAYEYRAGYAYDAGRGSMQKVWVPVTVPSGYGYR